MLIISAHDAVIGWPSASDALQTKAAFGFTVTPQTQTFTILFLKIHTSNVYKT
jgi:hypothetical protein